MTIKQFGSIAGRLARNPLGIIALAFVLVYGITGLAATSNNFNVGQREILTWFLVVYPCVIIFVFYLLVSRHHEKLYAPSDFNDETNFMAAIESKIEQSPKLNHIEELTNQIKQEIDNQPLYKYMKLTESGKIMVLQLYDHKTLRFDEFTITYSSDHGETQHQAKMLNSYGWCDLEKDQITITDQGKKDIGTFEDICYGRMR
jgi:hypothetical protein